MDHTDTSRGSTYRERRTQHVTVVDKKWTTFTEPWNRTYPQQPITLWDQDIRHQWDPPTQTGRTGLKISPCIQLPGDEGIALSGRLRLLKDEGI